MLTFLGKSAYLCDGFLWCLLRQELSWEPWAGETNPGWGTSACIFLYLPHHSPIGFQLHGQTVSFTFMFVTVPNIETDSLLQDIFPSQGSNSGLPHCRQILYQLSHKGSPRRLEWVAYPFSSGSPQPRNWTSTFQADSLPTELSGKHWD